MIFVESSLAIRGESKNKTKIKKVGLGHTCRYINKMLTPLKKPGARRQQKVKQKIIDGNKNFKKSKRDNQKKKR